MRAAARQPALRLLQSLSLRTARAAPVASSSRLHTSTGVAQAAPVESTPAAQPAESVSPATTDATGAWKPTTARVGLIGVKQGMTSFFLPDGKCVPATVLQIQTNRVSAHVQGQEGSKYTGLQVAAINSKTPDHITKQIRGHLLKAGIYQGKRVIREFAVSPEAFVPLGTMLSVAHFVPGQSVDVRGITRGRGFAGAMKRHGFKGQSASHGTSLAHRSLGATGANQDPGRVWPGKKMAGRMGGNKHGTIHNLLVVRIDVEKELLYVKGNVPGPRGGSVTIQDARRPNWKAQKIYRRGRLPNGEALTGNEPDSLYLARGVEKLPFPAGTKELAGTLPSIVEVGLQQVRRKVFSKK